MSGTPICKLLQVYKKIYKLLFVGLFDVVFHLAQVVLEVTFALRVVGLFALLVDQLLLGQFGLSAVGALIGTLTVFFFAGLLGVSFITSFLKPSLLGGG